MAGAISILNNLHPGGTALSISAVNCSMNRGMDDPFGR